MSYAGTQDWYVIVCCVDNEERAIANTIAQTHDLQASGIDKVLRDTLFAVVGAVSLQKGGDVANQVVRTRILRPLGVV